MVSNAVTLAFAKVRARHAEAAAEGLAVALEKLKRGVEDGDLSAEEFSLVVRLMGQAEDAAVALHGIVNRVEARQKAAALAAAEAERAAREAAEGSLETALLRVVQAFEEAAASDEVETGDGCYLVLGPRLGLPAPAYLLRIANATAWDVAGVEVFATERAGWDRFNALCATDQS
jgi:hypothetical protein